MSNQPDADNIIRLDDRKAAAQVGKKERYQLVKARSFYNEDGSKKCRHRKVLIDEAKSEVECEECGAMLNPVWLLGEFMRIESVWNQQLAALKRQIEEAADKTRCKCIHCNKMTPIAKR